MLLFLKVQYLSHFYSLDSIATFKRIFRDHLGFSTSIICQKAVKKGASDQLDKEGFLEDYCNRTAMWKNATNLQAILI